MANDKKRSKVSVVKEFFEMESKEIMAEWRKDLTDGDKLELAQGAAGNLGLKQDDVNFPLV